MNKLRNQSIKVYDVVGKVEACTHCTTEDKLERNENAINSFFCRIDTNKEFSFLSF